MRQFVLIRRIKEKNIHFLKIERQILFRIVAVGIQPLGFALTENGFNFEHNMGKLAFIAKEQFGGQSMASY